MGMEGAMTPWSLQRFATGCRKYNTFYISSNLIDVIYS